jgi:hypothetical protein
VVLFEVVPGLTLLFGFSRLLRAIGKALGFFIARYEHTLNAPAKPLAQ